MTYPRVATMPRRSHAATIVLTAIAASIALLIANLGFASASHAATFGYLDYSLLPNGNITITGCAGARARPASIVILTPSTTAGPYVTWSRSALRRSGLRQPSPASRSATESPLSGTRRS